MLPLIPVHRTDYRHFLKVSCLGAFRLLPHFAVQVLLYYMHKVFFPYLGFFLSDGVSGCFQGQNQDWLWLPNIDEALIGSDRSQRNGGAEQPSLSEENKGGMLQPELLSEATASDPSVPLVVKGGVPDWPGLAAKGGWRNLAMLDLK